MSAIVGCHHIDFVFWLVRREGLVAQSEVLARLVNAVELDHVGPVWVRIFVAFPIAQTLAKLVVALSW